MYQQSEKKNLLNGNMSSACLQNMANFGPLTPEIGSEFGAPQQISTGFASCLRYCSDVAQRRPTKLCTMFGRLLGWYTIYTFSGAVCPLTELYPVQNSLCVQVLRSPIAVTLVHGSRPVGISKTLRCGIFTRQGGHPVRHWAVELPSLR